MRAELSPRAAPLVAASRRPCPSAHLQSSAVMAPAVDEATQSSIDALVDSVDKRDALLTFHWVHELKPSGRSALSMPSELYLPLDTLLIMTTWAL